MGVYMIDCLLKLHPVLLAFIGTLVTYTFTMLGAGVVFFFKRINKNVMDASLAFASGVMISASFFSLLLPGIQMASVYSKVPYLISSIGFLSGGIIVFLGDKFCDLLMMKKNVVKEKGFKRSLLLVSSITIHNIPEGLAVGVAFGSLIGNMSSTSLASALVLALGIGIQNFPEGAIVSLPLRREGYSIKKSFFYGQLSGVVEPIFGVIGALLVTKVQSILPFFLCFAAGAMIYVVAKELIPESQNNDRKDLMAFFVLIGFSLMMILDVALS